MDIQLPSEGVGEAVPTRRLMDTFQLLLGNKKKPSSLHPKRHYAAFLTDPKLAWRGGETPGFPGGWGGDSQGPVGRGEQHFLSKSRQDVPVSLPVTQPTPWSPPLTQTYFPFSQVLPSPW